MKRLSKSGVICGKLWMARQALTLQIPSAFLSRNDAVRPF